MTSLTCYVQNFELIKNLQVLHVRVSGERKRCPTSFVVFTRPEYGPKEKQGSLDCRIPHSGDTEGSYKFYYLYVWADISRANAVATTLHLFAY